MRKNKFIQRKQQSMKNAIILLILMLGIGYALIQSNLNINGTANMGAPTWNIHWENVQVKEGSVSASTPTINSAQTTVTYSVVLNVPGDYYEFTVDAVNSGTIDGMIESITSKLNGATITNLPNYLEYTISYADDVPLAINQLLAAGTTETYKVRIKYKDDIELNQIPATNQNLPFQFTVKYRQATEDAIEPNRLYNILRDAANEGTYAKKYTGGHHDSFTEEPSKDIYHWWADNGTNGTAILDKNNVIFAGFCWQMIRTTDTGGVKIIYNGVPSSSKCNNEGESQQIGTSAFNTISGAILETFGYMYNMNKAVNSEYAEATSGSLFGTGVTYSNGTYTLTSTSTTYDTTHHYTCNNTTGNCSTVRYYYFGNNYAELNNGRTIEQALTDMLSADDVNQTNSTIKTTIDNWYAANMTSHTSKLEDTIFCNDRSISNLGGFNPNGGSIEGMVQFKNYNDGNNDLSCTNETDKFSLANPKAKLTYSVGLLTAPESRILNNANILKTGIIYWLLSPAHSQYSKYIYTIYNQGARNKYVPGSYQGVRPVVSLRPGTLYTSGDGSKNNPYIVQ